MSREETIPLTDLELAAIQKYADTKGITVNEAATELASKALESRMRRKTKRSPARNVVKFRGQ